MSADEAAAAAQEGARMREAHPEGPAGPSTAVVTGGGSPRGLGREIALELGRRGWAVAVLDLDAAAAEETAALVRGLGRPALGLGADVSDPASVDAAFGRAEAELPPVEVLVNNAGISAPTRFQDISLDEWRRMFEVNVVGTVVPTQRVLPGMRERGYGRIVNMSSVSAQRGGGIFGASHYSASKAAVLGLTKALAREVGADGITVNAVAPGMADTNITRGAMTAQRRDELAADTLLGRLAEPADVANAVAFLASPASAYVTGATIDVNGGTHLH